MAAGGPCVSPQAPWGQLLLLWPILCAFVFSFNTVCVPGSALGREHGRIVVVGIVIRNDCWWAYRRWKQAQQSVSQADGSS